MASGRPDLRTRLERGLLRHMDVQNASYPVDVPQIDAAVPVDMAKLIADNFPVVLKNVKVVSSPVTTSKLREAIGELDLKVAHTPYGNADSPLHGLAFVQPRVLDMKGNDLIDLLQHPGPNDVYYMQSQDGNLAKEFESLADKVIPTTLPIISHLYPDGAEAVNLWIGSGRTTSRLHNDNYENLFVQLSGCKRITLMPPGDAYAVDEKFLVPATYTAGNDGGLCLNVDGTSHSLPVDCSREQLQQVVDGMDKTGHRRVLFPTVDPNNPATYNSVFREHSTVYRVLLGPGDTLFIPALWYHQVEIVEVPDELCVSVNYWYPASPLSGLWARWDLVRYTSALVRGYEDDEFFDSE